MQVQRIAVVGAGNLGAFLAAHLTVAGHEVFFCARRPVPVTRIEGLKALAIPYFLGDPPPADIVLLTVKAHDTSSALGWLARLCDRNQPVAVVQNGVQHADRVAPYQAIPVLSYTYVEFQGGAYRVFMPPRAHFTVPDDTSSLPFVNLFRNTPIRVHLETAFHVAAWRKMFHNCVTNPLTALAGRGLEILTERFYRNWAEQILAEALPIAQADSAELSRRDCEEILDVLASCPLGTRTSMLQDREEGKVLEIDVLNGALIELGRQYRIATPVNEELADRLRACQPGKSQVREAAL